MSYVPARTEAKVSIGKLSLLTLGSITFVALGYFMILHPRHSKESSDIFMGYAGMVFFSVTAIVGVFRMFLLRGVVLSVGVEGILDKRISRDIIHWTDIDDISTIKMRGSKFLMLKLKQSAKDTLALTPTHKIFGPLNQLFGYKGLWLATTELDITFAELEDHVMALWKAHQNGAQ